MNTDYSYCSGVTCSIRKSCKRYLPDSPDIRLRWVCPAYNPNSQMGTALTAMAVNGMLPTPTASCYNTGTPADRKDGKTRKSQLNHLIARKTGHASQLNPLFVAEMMGFPPDWTVLPFQSGGRNR